MEKCLFCNGISVLRIKDGNYYILSEDQECMQRVDFNRFVEKVRLFKDLYEHTWSGEFKKEYEDILEYIRLENYI